jgi:tetratricopeptide (TPR) repeat protein
MQEEVLATGHPIEDVALYFGWYTEHASGALARENFRFRPGAIAYHIHSASASTLRSERRYWAGPLVARGAAFTMGAVSEPFLTYTPELNILAERLVSGYAIGDAVLLSQRSLSWQMTIIGDPLYRPFSTPLSEQIVRLREEGKPEIEWAYVRQANLMIMQGRFNPALAYLRAALRETDSLVIREKLGDLYVMNELFNEAGRYYEEVLNRAETAETAVRVGARWIQVLQRLGQSERGERLKQKLKSDWPDSPAIQWLDRF